MNFETLEPVTNDFLLNVALGRYGGKIVEFKKFSKAISLKTTLSDIWTLPFIMTYATEGETLYISSTSTEDTAVEVSVMGLDENGYYKEQPITINGTTPVQLSGLWLRTFRIKNVNGTINVGEIYISTSSNVGIPADSTVRCHGIAGTPSIGTEPPIGGSTFMSHFTVPKGYVALIIDYTTIQPGSADIDFVAYARGKDKVFIPLDQTGGTLTRPFYKDLFDELTDFKIMAKASSTLNRDVAISYKMLLVDRTLYNSDGTKIKGAI
jgi:hypothetical protein